MRRLVRSALRHIVIRLTGWSERLTHWLEDLEWELEDHGPPLTDEQRMALWKAHVDEHLAAFEAVSSKRDIEHAAHVELHLSGPKGGLH